MLTLSGAGQPQNDGGGLFVGLLDTYPNAAAAYSLRDLASASVGNAVVRVRRSSDNTEQDFTSTEITDGTLTTFTGANDGLVTTWYDQSGEGNDAVNTTAIEQPQIVDNGVVETLNGKPCFKFFNTSTLILSSGLQTIDNTSTSFVVNNVIQSSSNQFILYSNAFAVGVLSLNYWNLRPQIVTKNQTVIVQGEEVIENNQLLGSFLTIPTNGTIFVNSLLSASFNKSRDFYNPTNQIGYNFQSKIQEIVFYNSNESSNRTGIEKNINTEYTIYQYRGNIVGGLLFDYPTSNGAYSLRNLAEYDNGFWPVIRIRRSNDNVEQDIFATDITDGTLESFIGVGNDGFVTKWYNQIPALYGEKPNDASETTAINQPKLVSNGVVITDNGKPALFYDSTGSIGLNLLYDFNNINSVFQVLRTTSTTGNTSSLILGTKRGASPYNYLSGASGQWLSSSYTRPEIQNGSNYLNDSLTNMTTTVRTTNQYLLSMIHTAAVGEVGSFSNDRNINGRSWEGYMQEIILYPTDQTTNRDAIKTNINAEYTIY